METRNELASMVLNSEEFQDYIEKKKTVESNAALFAMIAEYETATSALVALMQTDEYDAAEAIRLTNDAEFLSGQIERHHDYINLAAANERLQAFLSAHKPACGGSCEGCTKACHKEH